MRLSVHLIAPARRRAFAAIVTGTVAMGAAMLAGASVVPPAVAASGPLPRPACPQVEGWNPAGTFGPIDQGLGYDFQCMYAIPGQAEQLTLDTSWVKPTARDVDVDYSKCGRAPTSNSYQGFIYGGRALARVIYEVTSGFNNGAVFAGDRARIEVSAQGLLKSTEALAKSCTKRPAVPPASRTVPRPTVAVHPAVGTAASDIPFRFTIASKDRVGIVLTIYDGTNQSSVVLRHNFGEKRVNEPPWGSRRRCCLVSHF